MKSALLANWRTALVGILAGVVFVAPQVQACLQGQPCDPLAILKGGLLAALGILSKDHNS